MVQKTARIQDVARAAGVSTATVSRALSNPNLLTESTRNAVFEAIRETGYRVNRAARNLRTQKAGAVLVLVPNLGNPFFSQILAGISAAFSGTEYSVLISDTANGLTEDKQPVDHFLDSRIDGMIVLDGGLDRDQLSALTRDDFAHKVVFACEWAAGEQFPSIRSDNLKGATLAVEHLYNLGHRKIAHVTGPADNVLTHVRRDGMIEARNRLNLPFRDDWILRGDFSLKSGRDAAMEILQMEDRPTAVFCASDQVAFGLIATLQAHGVSVPGDMSVVGFDDIELSEFYVPSLTTIRQDRQALGQRAAQTLLNSLTGSAPAHLGDVHLVDVELVTRESTAPLL